MAIDFDGVDDVVNMGTDLPFLNGAAGATMMTWIISDESAANRDIGGVAIGPPPGTSGTVRFAFAKGTGGIIDLRTTVRQADTDFGETQFPAEGMTENVWHHGAATWDCVTKEMRLFYDGVFIVSNILSGGGATGTAFASTNCKNGAIGGSVDAVADFNGKLEDWRIYRRRLGDAEIATIFAARGADGIILGLECRYVLNELASALVAVNCVNLTGTSPPGIPAGSPLYFDSVIRGSRTKRHMGR